MGDRVVQICRLTQEASGRTFREGEAYSECYHGGPGAFAQSANECRSQSRALPNAACCKGDHDIGQCVQRHRHEAEDHELDRHAAF